MKRTIIILVTLLAACTPRYEYTESGGAPLEGTQNNHSLIGGAFSLSPDSRFLFTTTYDPLLHGTDEGEVLRHAILVDLDTNLVRAIQAPSAATDAISKYGMLPESGCWRDNSLYLRSNFRIGWALNSEADELVWAPVDSVPCAIEPPQTATFVAAETQPDGRVQIRDTRSGRVIALFESSIFDFGEIQVSNLIVTNDLHWLAFTVSKPFGSFTGNTEGYITNLQDSNAQPQLLASPVGTMKFAPDSKAIYAHTRAFVDKSGWVVAVWDLGTFQ